MSRVLSGQLEVRRSIFRASAVLLLGAASLVLTGCASPISGLRIEVLQSRGLPGIDDSAAFLNEGNQGVRLESAANETVSFCIAITSSVNTVESPRLVIGPIDSLSGRLPRNVFTIFRLLPVESSRLPGWHVRAIPPNERENSPLDVLVPIDAHVGVSLSNCCRTAPTISGLT